MEKYAVPNKLPAKQVSILARRKTRIDREKNLAVLRAKTRTNILKKKAPNFRKAETFVMEYLNAERDANRIKRQVLTKKNFAEKLPCDKKLILIMRHRTNKIASPTIKKVLKKLRLNKKHSTVFVKNTKEVAALLPIIEPYVVYGAPNINLVRELIFKFGKIFVNGKRTGIQSNVVIEELMGQYGIICVEDIIHMIVSCGEHFDDVNNLILPFTLKAPRDGWKKKLNKSYKDGGEYGNRGDEINSLIPLCI